MELLIYQIVFVVNMCRSAENYYQNSALVTASASQLSLHVPSSHIVCVHTSIPDEDICRVVVDVHLNVSPITSSAGNMYLPTDFNTNWIPVRSVTTRIIIGPPDGLIRFDLMDEISVYVIFHL
jgi:hypothetical protein